MSNQQENTAKEEGERLRRIMLPLLASQKPGLERLLKEGPTKPEDNDLLISAVAFALAEVTMWEGNNQNN